VCGEEMTADAAEECHEGKLKDVLRGYLKTYIPVMQTKLHSFIDVTKQDNAI
jgi:hypothetical protein